MFAKFVVILSALAVTSARTTWKDLHDYTFEKYVAEFGKSWAPGSADWNSRKQLFDVELERVRAHNTAGKSWKEGVNKFSAMTTIEKQVFQFFVLEYSKVANR